MTNEYNDLEKDEVDIVAGALKYKDKGWPDSKREYSLQFWCKIWFLCILRYSTDYNEGFHPEI